MKGDPERALAEQAERFADAAKAAARWFRRPAPSRVAAAKTARLRAFGSRDAAVPALKRLRGPVKEDAADMSFALREAAEHAVKAVVEAERFGVPPDEGLAGIAAALDSGAEALLKAAKARPAERAEALVEAKRWALQAESARRAVRSDAHEDPRTARGLSRDAVATRLSDAAEALQQACDALSGSLAP